MFQELEWQGKVTRDPAYFDIDFKVSVVHMVRTVSMYIPGCSHGDVTLGGLEQIRNEGKQKFSFNIRTFIAIETKRFIPLNFYLYNVLNSPCRIDSLVPMTSFPASPKTLLPLLFRVGQVKVLTHENE